MQFALTNTRIKSFPRLFGCRLLLWKNINIMEDLLIWCPFDRIDGKPCDSCRRKVLEEGKNERLGKDNPCRDNDTADETKVQVEELRGRLNLVDDGKLGRAFLFHFQTFLCLHTVNMGPGKDVVGVFINIIISILSYRHNPPPQKTVMICRSIFYHCVLITN